MKGIYTIIRKVVIMTLLLPFVGVLQSQAQVFAPLGAEWHYTYSGGPMSTGYTKITVVKDTLIDGRLCTKLQKEQHYAIYGNPELIHQVYGYDYVTQTDDMVQIFVDGQFYNLYDFGSEVGDVWTVFGRYFECEADYGTVHVVGKGTEKINGVSVRYVEVVDGQYSSWGYGDAIYGEPQQDTVKIIERVGPVGSFLFPRQKCEFDGGGESGLLRCYSDSELGQTNFTLTNTPCDYINSQNQSVEELALPSIEVYPNPCDGVVTIAFPTNGKFNICVYDRYGREVKALQSVINTIAIDMSDMPQGMYYLTASDGNSSLSKKIILK